MIFKEIKEHFTRKNQNENNWFVMEIEKDDVRYIMDKPTLEFMLAEKVDLQYLINNGAVNRLGWHIGKDQKVYERYQINHYGENLCNFFKTEVVGKSYLKALKEINDNNNPKNLQKEKTEICSHFRKNQIKSIKKYDAKELKKDEEITQQKNKPLFK